MKHALWLIFLLFFGLPLLVMFIAIVLPLFYNHPMRYAGFLVIILILAILVVYFVKRTGKHNDKKP